jgi:hypothetical protein
MAKWLVLLLLCAGMAHAAWVRPEVRGLRVPDGAITLDGNDADWACYAKFDATRVTAQQDDHYIYRYPERGVYAGAADCSLTASFAMDGANLYILADVHDDILVNDSDLAQPFLGDDFEIFIDANPPTARFATKKNDNVRQLIIVPAYINPALPKGGVWQADTCPGVAFASRLRPWGYTVEVRVPKALFPAWQADPAQATVGIDIGVNDADAAGVDVVHAAIKGAFFLLTPGGHFMEPSKLGLLSLEDAGKAKKVPTARAAETPFKLTRSFMKVNAGSVDRITQAALDLLPTRDAAEVAQAAVASPNSQAHTVGLLMLAKRPELGAAQASLEHYARPGTDPAERAAHTYALMALAHRRTLPLDLLDACLAQADPALRLTGLYAVAINGDKAAVPALLPILKDANLRVRMMAALALGRLRDPAVLDALRAMAQGDAHQYGRMQATQAITQIGAK